MRMERWKAKQSKAKQTKEVRGPPTSGTHKRLSEERLLDRLCLGKATGPSARHAVRLPHLHDNHHEGLLSTGGESRHCCCRSLLDGGGDTCRSRTRLLGSNGSSDSWSGSWSGSWWMQVRRWAGLQDAIWTLLRPEVHQHTARGRLIVKIKREEKKR